MTTRGTQVVLELTVELYSTLDLVVLLLLCLPFSSPVPPSCNMYLCSFKNMNLKIEQHTHIYAYVRMHSWLDQMLPSDSKRQKACLGRTFYCSGDGRLAWLYCLPLWIFFFFLLFSWMIIILIDNNSVAERMLC